MMNTIELKNNFHSLIESIDDENLLKNFYDLIKSKSISKPGQLWDRLNKNEQEELLTAFDESETQDNLIDFDTMKKKHQKWL